MSISLESAQNVYFSPPANTENAVCCTLVYQPGLKRFAELRVGLVIQLSNQPRDLCIYLSISTGFQQLDACGR